MSAVVQILNKNVLVGMLVGADGGVKHLGNNEVISLGRKFRKDVGKALRRLA
jgi:hypothetical protein